MTSTPSLGEGQCSSSFSQTRVLGKSPLGPDWPDLGQGPIPERIITARILDSTDGFSPDHVFYPQDRKQELMTMKHVDWGRKSPKSKSGNYCPKKKEDHN